MGRWGAAAGQMRGVECGVEVVAAAAAAAGRGPSWAARPRPRTPCSLPPSTPAPSAPAPLPTCVPMSEAGKMTVWKGTLSLPMNWTSSTSCDSEAGWADERGRRKTEEGKVSKAVGWSGSSCCTQRRPHADAPHPHCHRRSASKGALRAQPVKPPPPPLPTTTAHHRNTPHHTPTPWGSSTRPPSCRPRSSWR